MRVPFTQFLFRQLHVMVALTIVAPLPSVAEDAPLTPQACTEVRYLAPDDFNSRSPLALSPNGSAIAYVIQVPDISANNNSEALYVAPLNSSSNGTRPPLIVNKRVAAIQWFSDSRYLAALIDESGVTALVRIDSQTGAVITILKNSTDITDYSMSADGNTIVVGVREGTSIAKIPDQEKRDRDGYRIDLEDTALPGRPRRRIFILRNADAHWNVVQRVEFESPLSGLSVTSVSDIRWMHLNLSPNGKYLLIENTEEFSDIVLPDKWQRSPIVGYQEARVEGIGISYLYDIETKAVSLPIESPEVLETIWAPNSRSFAVRALPPVGSQWEVEDMARSKPNDHLYHLFTVDIKTGIIGEVLNRSEIAPLGWTPHGEIIVRDELGTVRTFQWKLDRWVSEDSFRIPLKQLSPYSLLVSDGVRFVGEYEAAAVPPEIYEYLPPSLNTIVISDLNPAISRFTLPRAEDVTWPTSSGYLARGVVLLPPDYDPRRRYPLVIEDGSILYSGGFACDSGPSHVSSFARGMLADAGIIYLMRSWPGIENWENNFYPSGYPGGIAEAVFRMELVEGAVRYLGDRKMIDTTKVGLIGFSRGGWYTEYALAHSQLRFAVAVATDNIQYSIGEYWYLHDPFTLSSHDAMFGGPPYGPTLKNWEAYSISFNLDKIRTPLLIDVMGDSRASNDPQRASRKLAVNQEVLVGLRRQHDPVELYFYPTEVHQADDPATRLIALQRDIDWLRFWLQGYEAPSSVNSDNYRRWELMCKEANEEYRRTELSTSKSESLPCASPRGNTKVSTNTSPKTSAAR